MKTATFARSLSKGKDIRGSTGSPRTGGFFITLEGPDGAGKSTHARLLAGWLRRRGRKVLLTHEPGGTWVGTRLRKLLLHSEPESVDPFVELLLYEASRALIVRQVIRPALKAGKTVILDRFQDSTWVYQGWAGGMDLKWVEEIGRRATGGLQPDLTILLDVPARRGLSRVRRPNRMEAKPVAFHEKVRRGYRVLAHREKKRIRLIWANRPAVQVQEIIRKAVSHLLR